VSKLPAKRPRKKGRQDGRRVAVDAVDQLAGVDRSNAGVEARVEDDDRASTVRPDSALRRVTA
jgi:hypothetical protein